MKVYGIFDLVMEDYVMVTLANNDKTAIRGLRCPEQFDPNDFELRCICDLSDFEARALGKLSEFVDEGNPSSVSPASIRNIDEN